MSVPKAESLATKYNSSSKFIRFWLTSNLKKNKNDLSSRTLQNLNHINVNTRCYMLYNKVIASLNSSIFVWIYFFLTRATWKISICKQSLPAYLQFPFSFFFFLPMIHFSVPLSHSSLYRHMCSLSSQWFVEWNFNFEKVPYLNIRISSAQVTWSMNRSTVR